MLERAPERPFLPGRYRRSQVPMVTRVRSTMLASSLRALRMHGFEEAYFAALDPRARETMTTLIAGVWVDVSIAQDHYRACDALCINPGEIFSIGREVGRQLQGTILSTMLGMAKGTGVTVWTGLARLSVLWARLMEGGDVVVWELGPKDARVELLGVPMARSRYFRAACRGQIDLGTSLFCTKGYVKENTDRCTDSALVVTISWA